MLGTDSQSVAEHWPHGQLAVNIAAPLALLVILSALEPGQRLAAVLFVPFSAFGEYLFSLVFGLYSYRRGGVPLYVPFGHAILFGSGLVISGLPQVLLHETVLRRALLVFHTALLAGVVIILGDTLSALFGVLLVVVLLRRQCSLFYVLMGVLVLIVELLGTAFGCWYWWPNPVGGWLYTTNPPVGAFACYLVADVCVLKIAAWLTRVAPAARRVVQKM